MGRKTGPAREGFRSEDSQNPEPDFWLWRFIRSVRKPSWRSASATSTRAKGERYVQPVICAPTHEEVRAVEKKVKKITYRVKHKSSTRWRIMISLTVFSFIIWGSIAGYIYNRYQTIVNSPNFPKLEDLLAIQFEVSTQVFDNTGKTLVGEIHQTRRIPVELKDVSTRFIDALKAAEDADFDKHNGVDQWGIAKAILRKIRHPFSPLAGASTLDQQILKNRDWEKEKRENAGKIVSKRSLDKKIQENVLARQLNRKMSKDQILTDYVNTIYLGHRRYGVEAASQYYFGHSAKELTLAEASLLAALPKGANKYTAWKTPDGKDKRALALKLWKERQLYVLRRMVELGKATTEEARVAAEAPIQLAEVESASKAGLCDEFIDVIQKELKKRYGEKLFRTPLKVISTCDLKEQEAAKQAVERGLEGLDKLNGKDPMPEAAQIVLDETGAVRAMVGGYGYRRGLDMNRALYGKGREAGSLFKTFLWLAAFISGQYNTDSTFVDESVTIPSPQAGAGDWSPQNSHQSETDGQPVTLGYALAKSLNTVAGQLVYSLRTPENALAGVDATIRACRQLGITSPLGRNYAMVLGTSNVRLSEMTVAYNTISNGGMRVTPRFIVSIQEGNNPVKVEEIKNPEQAISASAAHLTHQALEKVTTEGTGVRAGRELKRPIAGKTGTTQESRDGWFCGSVKENTHTLTSCAWVGYDKPAPLQDAHGKDLDGAGTALRYIWIPTMKAILDGMPVKEFDVPVEREVVAKPVEEKQPSVEVPETETSVVPETPEDAEEKEKGKTEEEEEQPKPELVVPF